MISLNYRDSRPIYEQIQDGLRRMIATGALATGEKLPSVRAMAAELAINPNTIQRAYGELEAEGYIVSVPGKGSFAAAPVEDAQKRLLLAEARALCARLRDRGCTPAQWQALYDEEGQSHD